MRIDQEKKHKIWNMICFFQFIASLGVLLFTALDYGYDENEQRPLESSLEVLIERLSSADSKPDLPPEESDDEDDPEDGHRDSCDEGIEKDSGEEEDDASSHGGIQHQEGESCRDGLTLEAVIEVSLISCYLYILQPFPVISNHEHQVMMISCLTCHLFLLSGMTGLKII